MRKGILLLICFVAVATVGFGQQEALTSNTSKTKLEQFTEQGGIAIIEGFTETGSINAILGGELTVRANEFINPVSKSKVYGVTIVIKKSNITDIGYIDYDEIDGILAALDFLAKVDKSATKLDNVNATFRTKRITFQVYTRDNGNVHLFVSSGNGGANFYKKDAAQIRTFIIAAKEKLDTIKQ